MAGGTTWEVQVPHNSEISQATEGPDVLVPAELRGLEEPFGHPKQTKPTASDTTTTPPPPAPGWPAMQPVS